MVLSSQSTSTLVQPGNCNGGGSANRNVVMHCVAASQAAGSPRLRANVESSSSPAMGAKGYEVDTAGSSPVVSLSTEPSSKSSAVPPVASLSSAMPSVVRSSAAVVAASTTVSASALSAAACSAAASAAA